MNNVPFDTFINSMKHRSTINHIYIFGAGTYGKLFGRFFNQYEISWHGFIDNNIFLQKQYICEKEVYPPATVPDKQEAYILIFLSPYVYKNDLNTIINQLTGYGFLSKNICYYGDCFALIDSVTTSLNYSRDCLWRNEKLKDIFAGKRCFILGNGPSLRLEDLNKLTKEITFGCNNIITLTDKINWHPTCFFCEDSIFIDQNLKTREDLVAILNKSRYIFTSLKSYLFEEYGTQFESLYFLHSSRLKSEMKFSDNICDKVYAAGTTLYTMIQTAVYMGLKTIYLLGVDFKFIKEVDTYNNIKVNTHINNHMELMEQIPEGIYHVDLMMEGYLCALDYAKKHGIKIYNATRGGNLEIFERVNFDHLFH